MLKIVRCPTSPEMRPCPLINQTGVDAISDFHGVIAKLPLKLRLAYERERWSGYLRQWLSRL